MKTNKLGVALLCAGIGMAVNSSVTKADVTLVENGAARVAIHVAPEVMASDKAVSGATPFTERDTEMQRRRLRESVNDLALYLKKISGAEVGVLQRAPEAADKLTPILIGQYAQAR